MQTCQKKQNTSRESDDLKELAFNWVVNVEVTLGRFDFFKHPFVCLGSFEG